MKRMRKFGEVWHKERSRRRSTVLLRDAGWEVKDTSRSSGFGGTRG